MKFQTTCIHGDGPNDATGAVSPAIYCTSTFSHPHVGESTGFNYTRESNPTHARLEKVMSALESGVDSLAFSSGMAAIDAVMRLLYPETISLQVLIFMAAPSVSSVPSTNRTV